ncbi:hypothetical protein J7L05_05650 [bacterium]|nr:hypothetical protein [bacterium]
MRIAIPTWQQRVSPLFDTAERIVIADVANGQITQMSEERIPNSSLNNRANYLAERKVDVLICGGISGIMVSLLMRWDINVISGTMGDINSVLDGYISNSLDNRNFRMPGCRGRGRKHRSGGQGQGQGRGRGNRNR